MSSASIRLVPRRWLRLSDRSARLRLTLMYSGMFLALGTAVILIIFLLVWAGTAIERTTSEAVSPTPGPLFHAAVAQQRSADVARLLAVSWFALALTAGASALLGWFAAGRVLRPLRNMTATARTISAGNLHQRLAVSGPEDEFKQLGDTFDDLLGRLEAAFAAQRRFVANAAHELRTPLTVERTLLQVALGDPNITAEQLRATCEELLASGRQHERLLDALLTLASSERGLDRRELLDLSLIVRSTLEAARPELESRELVVVADLHGCPVRGDAALLERLVQNLIDNAARYNLAGGRVEVTTGTLSGRGALTIRNSGPVVPNSEVERLLEPFERLDHQRTGPDGRYGLGLSIVRAIATAHDATLTVDPLGDGGLSVTVSFDQVEE